MYAHREACRPDQGREDSGAYCPLGSVVRESYDGIIGDAPTGAIPFGRLYVVSDSLRRHAYTVIVEAVMSTRKSSAKPAGLSQLNLNAAGIDVGATSHFVAVPADRAEQPVQEFAAFIATCRPIQRPGLPSFRCPGRVPPLRRGQPSACGPVCPAQPSTP